MLYFKKHGLCLRLRVLFTASELFFMYENSKTDQWHKFQIMHCPVIVNQDQILLLLLLLFSKKPYFSVIPFAASFN